MKHLLLLVGCCISLLLQAQPGGERQQMEKERQQIQQEIKDIQAQYDKVKGYTKASLAQLTILQRKLDVQDKYIGNINKEIHTLNDEIYLSNVEIYRLQVQLDTLKAQYAKSVVYAYKNKSSYDFLNFIFSANNFNDALKRVSYLKAYRTYRQQQVESIKETQRLIQERKQRLQGKQTEKKSALQNQQHQMQVLEDQKKEKDAVVNKLKSQQKDLSRQLAQKRKRDAQIRNQIQAIIRRDIENARKAEAARIAREKKTATTDPNVITDVTSKSKTTAPKKYLELNATDIALNANFEKNKGSLPWPVDNGVVSIPFGPYQVPGTGLKDINPCITISTPSAGMPVKAVFDGVVSAVSNTGEGMMVQVRHGKYYTVYVNLATASVSKDAQVKRGQVIGTTGRADDGSGGEMDFYLMNETKNINPQPWLRR